MHGFWQVEELPELADGLTACGKVAKGGCLFGWNFSVTRPTVLTMERGARPIMALLLP